ncbi:hypothetical protein BP6252_00544 [Coleophoma cylindrospora]|uniref:YMC020W-like alpha/beta hydrolase domain-containing protein n=1 Tax=Coleophoma cylindrospora TaxID=1849047 RepID=A0A3D8SQF0_9HELO|nr:hypothetical protein BP6252_00544 [Coleophoma cylindrospora]
MGPSRKKSRPNPPKVGNAPQPSGKDKITEGSTALSSTETTTVTTPAPNTAEPNSSVTRGQNDGPMELNMDKKETNSDASSAKTLRSTKSWYGGTWPRLQKSMASTKVARESILADKPKNGTAAADLSRFELRRPQNSDSRPPSMYLGKSKETSDVTMGDILETAEATPAVPYLSKSIGEPGEDSKPPDAKDIRSEPPSTQISDTNTIQRPATSSAWLGWLGRPDGYTPIKDSTPQIDDRERLPPPEDPVAKPSAEPMPTLSTSGDTPQASTAAVPSSTSWFGFWPSTESNSTDAPKEVIPVKVAETPEVAMSDTSPDKASAARPAAGSSWAFWSFSDSSQTNTTSGTDTPKEPGELAVIGESSQNKPEAAQAKVTRDSKKAKASKRGRPVSVEIDETTKKAIQLTPASTKTTPSASPTPSKTAPPNILIPSVKGTYHMMENPSILQQLARILQLGQQRPVKHVYLSKEMPKMKKALAIGVHGLFPAPLIRTVIGQPTGTSIRFANHAAAALRRWADSNGCAGCEVEKVALEGEGKIAERVDNLWKLLLNWIDHVRSADFILVACHSQGVPVSVMLVAKLIEFGVVTSARIGICAMAGVSLGPFSDYKSRLFSGSAGELFDFANPESVVSKRYEDSLRTILKYGVRVTYCGSIDDQLISMESSIFSTVSHPYIYRAVFIDGRIHAPDFIANLVGFALKLRNLGVSDHGLIRELSAPLAGSLYTGEGHSRLYDDEKVYDLALEFALETTSVGDVPLEMKRYEVPSNANPYILPWIMRGLLEEHFVKTELSTETAKLLKQFDEWKPATKVLKDVKYRLEAVRSKL